MNTSQEPRSNTEYSLLAVALERACRATPGRGAVEAFLAALCEGGILARADLRASFLEGGHLCVQGTPSANSVDDASPAIVETLYFDRGSQAEVHLLPTRQLDEAVARAVLAHLRFLLQACLLQDRCMQLERACSRRMEEVAAIYEIGRAMTGADLSQILETVAQKALQVLGGRNCAVLRHDAHTGELTLAATAGVAAAYVRSVQPHAPVSDSEALAALPAMKQLAAEVVHSGKPLLLGNEAHEDLKHLAEPLANLGSAMLVPISSDRQEFLGVLCICRERGAIAFDQNDLKLFQILAGQAGLAIASSQLTADLRRRVHELSLLSEVSRSVSSLGDLDALLQLVAVNICSFAQVDRCCIYLYDRSSRRYIPRAMQGYHPGGMGAHSVRRGQGVIGVVAMKQMPIVELNGRNALQPIRGFARALGVNSFAALPIVAKGAAIGVLLADNKPSGRPITADTVDRLTLFVDQVAVAMENALLREEREHRFRELDRLATQTDNILRSIATAVAVVDASGRITRWNDAAAALWGIPEQEALFQYYNALARRLKLPPPEVDRLTRAMDQVRETGRPVSEYNLRLHPEGRPECCVNMVVSPLTDRLGHRQGAVQATEDITERITLEAEMARMSRLADIGKLAAKLAHELRNPLSPIKGAAQLIRKEYGDDPNLREFLDIIEEEVNTLNRITSELLDFARPLSLDLRPINLNEILSKNLRFLAGYLSQRQIVSEFLPAAQLPQIIADPRQMDQVIRNLAINAAQAMLQGGRLRLATTYSPTQQTVSMEVSDTGPGIPPEALDTIFQPFFTTKTKGAGLGLPIVRKIVESHGGTIAVHSLPGRGTTFTVTLPLVPPGVSASSQMEGGALVPDE